MKSVSSESLVNIHVAKGIIGRFGQHCRALGVNCNPHWDVGRMSGFHGWSPVDAGTLNHQQLYSNHKSSVASLALRAGCQYLFHSLRSEHWRICPDLDFQLLPLTSKNNNTVDVFKWKLHTCLLTHRAERSRPLNQYSLWYAFYCKVWTCTLSIGHLWIYFAGHG